jgi:hypothetical protein
LLDLVGYQVPASGVVVGHEECLRHVALGRRMIAAVQEGGMEAAEVW